MEELTKLIKSAGRPYRGILEKPECVKVEMLAACKFLYEWRKFKPVIAGGALWSWTAGRNARDIDIFVKKSWGLNRRIKQEKLIRDGRAYLWEEFERDDYFGPTRAIRGLSTARYGAVTDSEAPVDFVVIQGRDPVWAVLNAFDFEHCKVGFGTEETVAQGADSYSEGELIVCFESARARGEKKIKSKLQQALWGSPAAKTKLIETLQELRAMYQAISKEAANAPKKAKQKAKKNH